MSNYQDLLDESFIEELNYEYVGNNLPIPEIEGNDNIQYYSKEYQGNGIDIIVVECEDRLVEFQKKLIKNQKSFFPNAHFLFISNNGKVFDLYNNATSSKLKKITYDEIGKNTRLFKEKLQLFDITKSSDGTELQINVEKAFDTSDKITKKFFDKFKKIHSKLQKAITGIENEKDRSWYASVMMNRIMFIYFLQKHYVIQDNTDFLLQKFDEITANGKDYYTDFLLPLFFYGFARRDDNPEKIKFTNQYGSIRYLNGGLFYPHHLEKKYSTPVKSAGIYEEKALNTKIGINPKLIKEILVFLNGYTWYLDNRPMKEDTDINPDVLGYIFEKYINQKELGAYYTKEDITEYISKNTIIPFIFDKMNASGYNAPNPNPLITNNNDIINAVGSYIDGIDDYKELKFLYKDVLLELSVLDPSVGSGAFLFAALNILLPIYQKTVFRLKEISKTEKDPWLKSTIDIINKHPEEYFLTKQIILNNLYGVDIVEEATEICKLRLFLQLASHLPDIKSIEPLPDIDFNIYAGNSLVGGLSWEDLEANYTMDLFTSSNRDNIKKDIENLSRLKTEYRAIQQDDDNEEALNHLKNEIETQEHRVNNDINIGIENPFHWFIDFNKILDNGGFDIIIGNPPYVEYFKKNKKTKLSIFDNYKIKNFKTETCGNLYAYFIERADKLLCNECYSGMIIPISSITTSRALPLQNLMLSKTVSFFSSFSNRPAKLFDGVEQRLAIFISKKTKNKESMFFSSRYNHWYSEERDELFDRIRYTQTVMEENYQSLPKFNEEEKQIIHKLYNHNLLESSIDKNGNFNVYFHDAPTYWIRAFSFQPSGYKDAGTSHYKKISFENENKARITHCVMNSSLYYIFFKTFSNCRDFSIREINLFPLDFNKINSNQAKGLINLSKRIEENYIKNRKVSSRKYPKGVIEFEEYYPKYAKNIFDEVDKILCEIYGMTDKDLDYIINYDLGYRTGE